MNSISIKFKIIIVINFNSKIKYKKLYSHAHFQKYAKQKVTDGTGHRYVCSLGSICDIHIRYSWIILTDFF